MTATPSGDAAPRRRAPQTLQRAKFALLAAVLAVLSSACTTVRLDVARPDSHAITPSEDTSFGRNYLSRFPASGTESGVRLLVSGVEAFVSRAVLAESAERTLDLQYYAVAQDATATLLLYRALLAAQRGVRVRLLLVCGARSALSRHGLRARAALDRAGAQAA